MRCWGELKSFRTQSVGEVSAVLSNSHFTVIPIFKQIKAGLMRWREPFSPAIKQTSPFWSGVKRSKRGVFFNEACQCSYGRGYTICIYQKPFFPTNTSSHLSQLFFGFVFSNLQHRAICFNEFLCSHAYISCACIWIQRVHLNILLKLDISKKIGLWIIPVYVCYIDVSIFISFDTVVLSHTAFIVP